MIFNQTGGSGNFVGIPKDLINGNELVNSSTVINLDGVEYIGAYALYNAYAENLDVTAINWAAPAQININGDYACAYCFKESGIVTADLSGIIGMDGSNACESMFENAGGLATLNLENLETVGNAGASFLCYNCSSLATVNLKKLYFIDESGFQYAFSGTAQLLRMDFPSLYQIEMNGLVYAFESSSIQEIYFYAIVSGSVSSDSFESMLVDVDGCTVHFPAVMQSEIEDWSSYQSDFGGTNTVVMFDIITQIEGADGVIYYRSQANSTPTATAWDGNGTMYYTDASAEPNVGDVIYTDDALTTQETTVAVLDPNV